LRLRCRDYRGVVVNVDDPLGPGRVRAVVPDVLGTGTSQWALPALPFARLTFADVPTLSLQTMYGKLVSKTKIK